MASRSCNRGLAEDLPSLSSNKQENHPVQASELARTGWFGLLRLVLAGPNLHIRSYTHDSHIFNPTCSHSWARGHWLHCRLISSAVMFLRCFRFDQLVARSRAVTWILQWQRHPTNINTIAVTNNLRMMEDRAASSWSKAPVRLPRSTDRFPCFHRPRCRFHDLEVEYFP